MLAIKKGNKKKWWRSYAFYFILPSLLLYLTFVFFPTIRSIPLSFTNWDGLSDPRFIGLSNFEQIFTSQRVRNALTNTLLLTVSLVILENIVALALALIVDNVFKMKNMFRVAFYLPVLISGIVMGFIWRIIYNYNFGVINQFLERINLDWLKFDWLGDPDLALFSIVIATVWKSSGYFMIIYLAALQGVPQDLYEAARIDGANRIQQFRKITWPLLASSVTVCVILSTINSLKVFDQIAIMTDGGPGFSTETLTYIIFKVAFAEGRPGYGTALALVLFIIIMLITIVQVRVMRKREVQL
ncbi:raffinose/stachyose/melibiose transport system permease protein [Amphibacillus marinus]|uniref:Raffinose/stachyose/melibiose transport system permease protein n=1 Tax=Amphibacillus marinus TaxID=872970 RepID=A0A1H8RBG1_9BACI|nr:sugar ABC transporter permease [Amphibacillus marinus]SEO63627.1 raffinose/stachyose/melibiose transport system permease protein [Amphibacillus marinus]